VTDRGGGFGRVGVATTACVMGRPNVESSNTLDKGDSGIVTGDVGRDAV
jgi:hydrogenase maturation factor